MKSQHRPGLAGLNRPGQEGTSMAMRPLSAPADVLAQPILLPYPSELPDGLPARPRVLQLTDADAVSRGLADGTPRDRASNREVRACLELVQATTRRIDPRARIVCAASSATATRHLDVMTASGGNTWLVRRGLDGADRALLEELDHLTDIHRMLHQPGRRPPAGPAELVILVAQDHIFARSIRRLRLLGVPTWLLVPGRSVARELFTAACAVTFIGPRPRPR
jgi:hypothetical protein